ncbi:monocyte to macrophage differentiation factor 2 isoform X2 [Atheta coriaria]
MIDNTSIVQQCLELSKRIIPCVDLKNLKWKNGKPKPNEAYCPTEIEHLANIVTHGIAILPCILGTYELCWRSESFMQLFAALIYGATLVFLFSISTCFHCVFFRNQNGHLKDCLHRCDRAMIYIFIAGSYFPWLMLCHIPHGGWAISMRWLIWIFALLGIVYQQTFHEQYKCLETCLYLFIGIMPAVAIFSEVDSSAMFELKLGGIFYTFGVFFFKADGRISCAHAIWHVFVIAGATVHYYAILTHLYKLPGETGGGAGVVGDYDPSVARQEL